MQACSNQVNNICALWLLISLFIQLSLCLSNGSINKVAIVVKMEDIHGVKHEFPLIKGFLVYPTAGCSISNRKDQHEPTIWLHTPDGQDIYLVAG